MRKIVILSIVISSFIVSCKHSKTITFLDSVYVIDCSFTDRMTIQVSDIVESIEFIPLETTDAGLVANVGKILPTSDKYYIGHSLMSGNDSIDVFAKNGKFLYSFNNTGQGPGQYIHSYDFCVDKEDNFILGADFKLMIFNPSDYSWISTRKTDAYCNYLITDGDDLLVYNKGNTLVYGKKRELSDVLTRIPPNGEEVTFLTPNRIEQQKMLFTSSRYPFSKYREIIYFQYPYCDTIYQIKGETLYPVYYFDFGNRKLPKEANDGTDEPENFWKAVEQNKGVFTIWNFHRGNNYLAMLFMDYRWKYYMVFHSLNDQKTFIGNFIRDDIFFKGNEFEVNLFPYSYNMEGNDIITAIDSDKLLKLYHAYRNRISDSEWKTFSNKYPQLATICETITEDDNPVLLRIKTKF